MINKTDERMHEVKNKLINTFIVVSLIFMLLIIPLLFLRSKGVFTSDVIAVLIAAISFSALHAFKEKVSLKFKIYIIIVLIGSVIINGLINFGFIASGKTYIILLSVFLSYVIPLKRTYTLLFVFLSAYAICAFLYINGYLTYNFNIINQINQPGYWIIDGAIILIVSVILISVGYKIRAQLTKNFDDVIDLNLELDVYRKKLETLVEKRTIELSQSNVKLENSLEREKELGVLKTSFVAMASHEFRTPLGAIQAATDVILRYKDKLSQEDIDKRLFKIKREVRGMTTMLEDVLIMGRSDAQKLEFNSIELDMVALVKNIISEYQLTQEIQREVIFKFSSDKIMLFADPKWINSIVINLFSNALKYSEPPASIGIEIRQEENEVLLSVTDKGIGISKKDQNYCSTLSTEAKM